MRLGQSAQPPAGSAADENGRFVRTVRIRVVDVGGLIRNDRDARHVLDRGGDGHGDAAGRCRASVDGAESLGYLEFPPRNSPRGRLVDSST